MSLRRERYYMDKKSELIRGWIHKAEHDLAMAELALKYKPELRAPICFHCQQAVEKTLKAYLVYLDIPFKKTHSLTYLLDLISDNEDIGDKLYSYAEILEGYAVEIRYPDGSCEPTEGEAREAYKIAEEIKQIFIEKLG